MKNFLPSLFLGLALCLGLSACAHGKLESGGAYAPLPVTNQVSGVVTTVAPDFEFFAADSAFDLAYATIDAAFTFERDNRAYLWSISRDIKRSLDKIRPEALTVRNNYISARAAYMANPTPDGLSTLQLVLGRAQQISAGITAILPKSAQKPPSPTPATH